MSEEREQADAQQLSRLLGGLQVEAGARIGLDVDGRYFANPLVQLVVLESSVVLQIDDAGRADQWVRIRISEQLLATITALQQRVSLSEGEQGSDENSAS